SEKKHDTLLVDMRSTDCRLDVQKGVEGIDSCVSSASLALPLLCDSSRFQSLEGIHASSWPFFLVILVERASLRAVVSWIFFSGAALMSTVSTHSFRVSLSVRSSSSALLE
ncbi:hypothetical protein PENTCL1PPCAC_26386, partial [Pristionchus entomophagus]